MTWTTLIPPGFARIACAAAMGLPLATILGCQTPEPRVDRGSLDRPVRAPAIGSAVERRGDEIMVAGRLVHTGAPVVLWFDPGGYDAYRVERRFASAAEAGWESSSATLDSPNRYGTRPGKPETGWTPESLAHVVDQIVVHYDAAGTARSCFRVLHDIRGLSAHFLLDVDGTIYQTLDVKERAWHATIANDRSIGVEIANIGAYPVNDVSVLNRWYRSTVSGVHLQIPGGAAASGVRTPGYSGRPAAPGPARGVINGQSLVQHDLTPEQYDSLARLVASLSIALPEIRLDAPRDALGQVRTGVLTNREFSEFSGILGHFHVQANKVDPGPAFAWESVLARARFLRSGNE